MNPALRPIGKRGSVIVLSTACGGFRSPCGWICCLLTPWQSVTVNSLTTRSGKVNVSGRSTSELAMRRNPEFLIRSSTIDGCVTSSWWVSTFHIAQGALSLASLDIPATRVSIWSRQVILRHRRMEIESHITVTAIKTATIAAASLGWVRSAIGSQRSVPCAVR